MNTINIAADATAQRIGIGNQYENEATAVVFDCSQFSEDHGAGTAQIIHRRPTESIGYVCTNVSQTNNTVTWLVTDDDTSFTGKGQVQLRWYVDDVLRESVIFPTYILPSVASSDDAPAEVKSAFEQLMEWVNDNTISIEDLDERIANYFDEHPIPTPVTSVNEKLGDVVLTAEDVGAYSTEEADEKFCVTDGEYEELNAGTSKQLLSDSYTLDQVPYLFRKSPNSDRAVEEIVGGTVGWNQLCKEFDSTNWIPRTSGSSVSFSNEIVTIGPTALYDGVRTTYSASIIEGHKYLVLISVRNTVANASFQVGILSSGIAKGFMCATANTWSRYSAILTASSSVSGYVIIRHTSSEYLGTLDATDFILSDLTVCFGTTIADYIYSLEQSTAGSGVAKLKEWGFFTEDYYEYCEPTLRSVEGLVSKKTVGFNQWDEEWEVGDYKASDGTPYASDRVRSKKENYIRVLPNTSYYFKTANEFMTIYFYDADKKYLSNTTKKDTTVTIPENCTFIRFSMATTYGTTYNHDICINLSDPTKNGTYEPYESHTYSLDSEVVLRGVPKLDSNNNLYFDGDVYPSDGNGSRRYGVVDLGSLEWAYITDDSYAESPLFASGNIPYKKAGSNNIVCGIYVTANSRKSIVNKVIAPWNNTNALSLAVRDDSYTDAATFKASLSGIYLLYELATPTTFTATPYHNPQIVGDTEEFVTTGIVPVGHSTKYYQNLRKKIENLPWNFSSLIAPTEVTNKATRNYTAGSYLILNNVLYKVTSNIANGGNITPNTNVTATTIMAEIMSL